MKYERKGGSPPLGFFLRYRYCRGAAVFLHSWDFFVPASFARATWILVERELCVIFFLGCGLDFCGRRTQDNMIEFSFASRAWISMGNLEQIGKSKLTNARKIRFQMIFSGVEILFYHTTAVRPPPEPPPCEAAVWGKFLFSYYFVDEELLIDSVSFPIVLGFFLPVLCLTSQIALYG
ncbi:unnamed protein product [Cuscuta epithymum]|uniref:Uncharacterized protein n=1 Tax=Cuscuta epithymum TaxID=186058 RepID=A0AAV0F250_9ASTE|nr:unnamed protein product [Cuscuta epithymum]